MTGKKVLIVVGVVLVLAAVVAANLYYRRETGLNVQAEALRTRDLEAIVSASGKVQPKRQVNVSANTTGRVTRVGVEEGEHVKAGQFLLEIDPKQLEGVLQRGEASVAAAQSSLAAARTAVEQGRANLELARQNLKRQQDLWKEGLTTRENLEFYARVGGLRRRERVVRIGEVVEAMNLEGFLERMTSALSGGMLRRLEIATALLTRPRVLFLDEPTVGLDPVARRLVWERLGALRESAGTTLLVTTHLMDEAEDHCERLAIMDRGRVVAEGAPAELRAEWGAGDLDEVFSTVTGREPEEAEGRIRDVRARRRIARRLG